MHWLYTSGRRRALINYADVVEPRLQGMKQSAAYSVCRGLLVERNRLQDIIHNKRKKSNCLARDNVSEFAHSQRISSGDAGSTQTALLIGSHAYAKNIAVDCGL